MKKLTAPVIVKFIIALFIVGFASGIVFYLLYKPTLSSSITTFIENVPTSHQNIILPSILGISLIFISSISIIGSLLTVFYLFYETFSIGFTFALFTSMYSLKGLLFYLFYFLVSKLLFIIILLYFSYMSLNYTLKFLDNITSKNRTEANRLVINHLYRFIIVTTICLVNGLFVYLFSNKLVCLFISLIK